jgi:hypothetical protein
MVDIQDLKQHFLDLQRDEIEIDERITVYRKRFSPLISVVEDNDELFITIDGEIKRLANLKELLHKITTDMELPRIITETNESLIQLERYLASVPASASASRSASASASRSASALIPPPSTPQPTPPSTPRLTTSSLPPPPPPPSLIASAQSTGAVNNDSTQVFDIPIESPSSSSPSSSPSLNLPQLPPILTPPASVTQKQLISPRLSSSAAAALQTPGPAFKPRSLVLPPLPPLAVSASDPAAATPSVDIDRALTQPATAGFSNVNSLMCWVNSLLQAIYACKPLLKKILENPCRNPLFNILKEALIKLIHPTSQEQLPNVGINIQGLYVEIFVNFHSFDQTKNNDPVELLDKLNEFFHGVCKIPYDFFGTTPSVMIERRKIIDSLIVMGIDKHTIKYAISKGHTSVNTILDFIKGSLPNPLPQVDEYADCDYKMPYISFARYSLVTSDIELDLYSLLTDETYRLKNHVEMKGIIKQGSDYFIAVRHPQTNIKYTLPSDEVTVNGRQYQLVSVVVYSGDVNSAKGGHYYTITKEGRLNDRVITHDPRIMQNFITNGYESYIDEQRRNPGIMYFFAAKVGGGVRLSHPVTTLSPSTPKIDNFHSRSQIIRGRLQGLSSPTNTPRISNVSSSPDTLNSQHLTSSPSSYTFRLPLSTGRTPVHSAGSGRHKTNKLTRKRHHRKIHKIAHTIKVTKNPTTNTKKTRRHVSHVKT